MLLAYVGAEAKTNEYLNSLEFHVQSTRGDRQHGANCCYRWFVDATIIYAWWYYPSETFENVQE